MKHGDEMIIESISIFAENHDHATYRTLRMRGETVGIHSIKDARHLIDKTFTELVVIDCCDDEEDALDVIGMIKVIKPDVPVVFITSSSSEAIMLKAFRKGAREHLKKPLNLDELREIIETILRMKRMTREKRISLVHMKDSQEIGRSAAATTGTPHNIVRAVQYIQDNLSENICLNRLSDEANLSRYHFSRVFKSYMGMSPMQFVNVSRIHKAKELLTDDDINISQVAIAVGFNDLSNFERQFKQITGITPKAFKRFSRPE